MITKRQFWSAQHLLLTVNLAVAMLVRTCAFPVYTPLRLTVTAVSMTEPSDDGALSRRDIFRSTTLSLAAIATTTTTFARPSLAAAVVATADHSELDDLLYRILRVREATLQESRLIRTGKFKDVQRANVKLAVKYMVNNYRLSDAFVKSSVFLTGNDKRLEAGQVGQTAVQNLMTIMEYFDSAIVQNLKVGSDSLSGKESLILNGLDAAKKNIDDFLAFFPADQVDKVRAKIQQENDLNLKEFDPALGEIVNLPVK